MKTSFKILLTFALTLAVSLPVYTHAQVSNNFWKLISNVLQPIVSTWGVSAPNLLVTGSTTLQNFTFVNATGTNATTTNLSFPTGGSLAMYNTADVTTNYERGLINWASNELKIFTEKAGSGTSRDIRISANNDTSIEISTGGGGVQFFGFEKSSGNASTAWLRVSGTLTQSSGVNELIEIANTINQSGTAGYTGLLINPTESATGSGAKNLILAQVGSANKFSINNAGDMTVMGSSTLQNFTAVNSTSSSATTTNFHISGNLNFNGVSGSTWASFCTTITGGAGLCDGSDDGGAGASTGETWKLLSDINFLSATSSLHKSIVVGATTTASLDKSALFQVNATGTTGTLIKASSTASFAGDFMKFTNSAGASLFKIDSSGGIQSYASSTIGGGSTTNGLTVNGRATTTSLAISDNIISRHSAGFLDFQRSGADFTLLRVRAPNGDSNEATISLLVDLDSPDAGVNEEYVDLYNERYADSKQWGFRQAYSGTGIPKPFVLGHWDTAAGKDAGNKLIILPSGTVAVTAATSTIDQTTAFEVSSSTAPYVFRANDSGPQDTSPFVVDTSGKVGVGSTTPSEAISLGTTGGTEKIMFPDGTTIGSRGILIVEDQKSANTAGGSSIAGNQTRTLNTVVANTITGASLGSNQVTLPAGTYRIEACAPAFIVSKHKAYWINVTDTSTTTVGTSAYTDAGDAVQTDSCLDGRFTISGSKAFELRHFTETVRATNGLGVPSNASSMVEVYARVKIEKE